MRKKRIIPLLDIKEGRVVKGVKFEDVRDVGDPLAMAEAYCKAGADELILLDITATTEDRPLMLEVIRKIAGQVMIPLTVGGGVRGLEDFQLILDSGADRVAVNTAAIRQPELLRLASRRFGSRAVVAAIDGKRDAAGNYQVVTRGGRQEAGMLVADWAKKVEELGAGEILLTSADADGTLNGYDLPMLETVVKAVNIPVMASGGCGRLEHFVDLFRDTGVSGAVAASLFHYNDLSVSQVKDYLAENKICVTRR